MNKKLLLVPILTFLCVWNNFGQETYRDKSIKNDKSQYTGNCSYKIVEYDQKFSKRIKNVILLIGDGMGVAQIYAGLTANQQNLYLQNCKHIGFSKTYSADQYVTDSAAGGTALATGHKTYNHAIGVDKDTVKVESILEKAEKKGLKTGLISTASITHATPASFIAHQPHRKMYEEIATDFLKTDIDVFIGGGYKHFTERKDGKNLIDDLIKKDYHIATSLEEVNKVKNGKLAGLLSSEHLDRYPKRGDILPEATNKGIELLNNDEGFFLMVEGAQIDWGGHQKNIEYVINETLDFDRAVGKALKFAAKDKKTLVIITADHETAGLALPGGNISKGQVESGFICKDHTGVMVPIFSFGPGAENFTGIMENIDIPKKIIELLKLK